MVEVEGQGKTSIYIEGGGRKGHANYERLEQRVATGNVELKV